MPSNNDDKTNLVVMAKNNSVGSRQAVSLQAGKHTIQSLETVKLLGRHISNDLNWKEHILTNEASDIMWMTNRVNGLCLVSHRATFGTFANGIVISRLCYLFQLWVGCVGYLLNSLQIIMNRAARSVTGYN